MFINDQKENNGGYDCADHIGKRLCIKGCGSLEKGRKGNSTYYVQRFSKYGQSKCCLLYTSGLKRISKPGLRVYAGKDELPRVLGGLGIAIISTNKGVITDKEARKLHVGGEVLAFVW